MAKLVFALELFVAAFAAQEQRGSTCSRSLLRELSQMLRRLSLVFSFAVLGLILCVVQTLVTPAGQASLFITVGGLGAASVALKTIALALPLLCSLMRRRPHECAGRSCACSYPYAFTIATVLRFVPVFI